MNERHVKGSPVHRFKRWPLTLAISLLALAPSARGAAQTWSGSSTLGVQIRDSKGPVAGAVVEIRQFRPGVRVGPEARRTDSRGQANFVGLAPGRWNLEIKHPDYLAFIASIQVESGKKPEILSQFLEASGPGRGTFRIKLLRSAQALGEVIPGTALEESAPAGPTSEQAPQDAGTTISRPGSAEPEDRARIEEPPAPPEATKRQEPIAPPAAETATAPELRTEETTPTEPPLPSVSAPGPPTAVAAIEEGAAADALAESPPPPEAPAATRQAPEPEAPAEATPESPSAVESPIQSAPAAPAAPAPGPAAPEAALPGPSASAPLEAPKQTSSPPPSESSTPEPATTPTSPAVAERPEPAAPPAAPDTASASEEAALPAPEAAPPAESTRAPGAPTAPAALTAFKDRTCFDCKPGEWAVAARAEVSGIEPCRSTAAVAVRRALRDVAAVASEQLADFAGPLPDSMTAFPLAAASTAARNTLAPYLDPASSCRFLAVVLPKGARFAGFRFQAADAQADGDCTGDEECEIGAARFLFSPIVERGTGASIVYTLFENTAGRPRTARMSAFFLPASGWAPR